MFTSGKPEFESSGKFVELTCVLDQLPSLDPEEIFRLTRIITIDGDLPVDMAETDSFDTKTAPNILVTGMPRLGKTTTLRTVSSHLTSLGVEHELIEEQPPIFPKDLSDEFGMFYYNLAFSQNGLANLVSHFHQGQLTLYDRGLVDHIVFCRSLDRFYRNQGATEVFGQILDDYERWMRNFLPLIDGIVICNSTAQTTIAKGSRLPRGLLENLSTGFEEFPTTLSKLKTSKYPQIPVIAIDFDNEDNPHDLLQKSINSLMKWNCTGQIK